MPGRRLQGDACEIIGFGLVSYCRELGVGYECALMKLGPPHKSRFRCIVLGEFRRASVAGHTPGRFCSLKRSVVSAGDEPARLVFANGLKD